MRKDFFTPVTFLFIACLFFAACKKEYSTKYQSLTSKTTSAKKRCPWPTYDYLNMLQQSYSSFSDMAEQIGMARVYAGIHTRYACDEGRKQGQKIAENILNDVKFLKE